MATISTLAVNLIARTSAFERGMNRSRKSVRGLKSTINGAIGSVARFAKGLVLAAGIGGMGFLLKNTLATLDAVSKLSRRLDISHEALLGLRFAGEQAGISVQAMDKALETFTRRMGEVKAGSGEAKRGLEALGLSAEKMIAMTPDKALLLIADRIETLGTQAEKAAAAYFLFGRAGAQMLNLFEKGAKGIEEAQKQAEEFGITLKGLDLTQIEAANDAVNLLKKTFGSLVQVLVIKFSPALTKIATLLAKNRDAIVSTVKNTIIWIAKTLIVVKTISLVGSAIRGLIGIYKSLAAAQTVTLALGGPAGWATIAAGAVIATGAIIGFNKAIDSAVAGLDKLNSKQVVIKDETALLDELARRKRTLTILQTKALSNETNGIIKAIASQKRIIAISEERLKIFREGKAIADAAAEADKQRLASLERFKGLEMEAKSLQESLITPAQKLRSEIKLINELFKKGLITVDQMFAATRKVSLGTLIADAEKLKQSLKTPLQLLEDQAKKIGVLFNAALITQEEFNKAIAKLDEPKLDLKFGTGEIGEGRFQEIRSEFIDVAALNAGGSTTGINKSNVLLEKANFINQQVLTEIKGNSQT